MKNIHVLQENIYITSDEEIKEGVNQWYLDKFINKPRNSSGSQYGEKQNVIILTTDQDLIKEGVEVINDDFLEWFVNNPSCEKVEVLRCPIEGLYTIIPKEEPTIVRLPTYYEPKQETTLEEVANEYSKKKYSIDYGYCEEDYYISFLSFRDGAKWQQERSYSEEEVREIIKLSCEEGMFIQRTINDKVNIPYTRIKDFTIKMFEQFKNK